MRLLQKWKKKSPIAPARNRTASANAADAQWWRASVAFPGWSVWRFFFYFCQSLTSHLPFSFPSPFDLWLIKGSSDLNIFPRKCGDFFFAYIINFYQMLITWKKIMWGIWMKFCTWVGSKMGTQTKNSRKKHLVFLFRCSSSWRKCTLAKQPSISSDLYSDAIQVGRMGKPECGALVLFSSLWITFPPFRCFVRYHCPFSAQADWLAHFFRTPVLGQSFTWRQSTHIVTCSRPGHPYLERWGRAWWFGKLDNSYW